MLDPIVAGWFFYRITAWDGQHGYIRLIELAPWPSGVLLERWLFLLGISILFRRLTFVHWYVVDARWFCWRDQRWEKNDAYVELFCAETTVVFVLNFVTFFFSLFCQPLFTEVSLFLFLSISLFDILLLETITSHDYYVVWLR